MKRLIALMLCITLLLGTVPCAFGASDSEATIAANTLNALGLFSGTGTNPDGTPIYSLEQTPNRHQAVTMLVKLLGKETEALNGTWETPFTDVANWAKPYVGYAYNSGLTSGTSATTYGGNNPVTATQYLTFVLSALGYTSGTDFKWNEAWKLSDQIGLTDGRYNANNTFLRGDIAIISANALDQKIKGTTTLMIDRIQENLKSGNDKVINVPSGAFKEYQSPIKRRPMPAAVGTVQPYNEYWFESSVPEDLTNSLELAYTLSVSDKTKFDKGAPIEYDQEALIEWGKDPGLNVRVLHEMGYTGKGAVIAYIDQPFQQHEQYNSAKVHYVNTSESNNSMHGPAVLSLLVGKDIGTAPEAEVYFYGHSSWKMDQTTHAECLYQIIEQNKKLPEDQRITMVGFSDNIDEMEKNADAFRKATEACEASGVKVFFCADYGACSFIPMSDKNNFDNVVKSWGNFNTVAIPTDGRTSAATERGAKYIYWGEGGLSWAMPYVLGLYAIAGEIDPSMTAQELKNTLNDTGVINSNGVKVVDPIGFVAKILEDNGEKAAANALREKAKAKTRYLYYVMNPKQMTNQDIKAVNEYLDSVTEAKVITVDSSYFSSATELYDALKRDHERRGGTVVGIQLLGEPSATPAFEIGYKVQMAAGIDDAGTMLTDFFYSNFENDSKMIGRNYSVYRQFEENLDVDLVAQWPVARLPLKKGEFAAFYEKYGIFMEQTGGKRLDIVNFSNPIFAQTVHSDDMGAFLNRAKNEFKILNVPYRLYAIKDGQYPVKEPVLGNFTADNLKAENQIGPVEFIINSHGQWNNIDRCYYQNGKEIRESLINMSNINQVLADHYYYMDTWTCENGWDMTNNLTSTALNGQCVGMFSCTHIISNNGVNNKASLSAMKQSNFYWFYYSYLKALNEGATRSEAFFRAQNSYGDVLMEDSKNGIRSGEGNYQFNLYNLLGFHNFGLVDPGAMNMKASDSQDEGGNEGGKNDESVSRVETTGIVGFTVFDELQSGNIVIHSIICEQTNDSMIFKLEVDAPEKMKLTAFAKPDASLFISHAKKPTVKGKNTYQVVVPLNQLELIEKMAFNFWKSDFDRCIIVVNSSEALYNALK